MTTEGPHGSREARDDALRAAIAALPGRKSGGPADSIKVTSDFVLGAYGLVVEAARARRMSVPAFIRRASYAMACHDLGIPVSEALTKDSRVARETGLSIKDPDGTKFGLWGIERLVGEDVDGPPTA